MKRRRMDALGLVCVSRQNFQEVSCVVCLCVSLWAELLWIFFFSGRVSSRSSSVWIGANHHHHHHHLSVPTQCTALTMHFSQWQTRLHTSLVHLIFIFKCRGCLFRATSGCATTGLENNSWYQLIVTSCSIFRVIWKLHECTNWNMSYFPFNPLLADTAGLTPQILTYTTTAMNITFPTWAQYVLCLHHCFHLRHFSCHSWKQTVRSVHTR